MRKLHKVNILLSKESLSHCKNMVSAGSGDLQRTLGLLLTLDLGEIRAAHSTAGGFPRLGGGDGLLASEMGGQLLHGADGDDLKAVCQSGFRGVVRRDIQTAETGTPGAQRHGQYAADRPELTGQGELADKGRALCRGGRQLTAGGENAHQNGEVIDGAIFLPVGRSQIDRDAGHGEGKSAGLDGGAHSLPGFLDGGIGQPDYIEGRQTAGQRALGADRVTGYAVKTQRLHGADHADHLSVRLLFLSQGERLERYGTLSAVSGESGEQTALWIRQIAVLRLFYHGTGQYANRICPPWQKNGKKEEKAGIVK